MAQQLDWPNGRTGNGPPVFIDAKGLLNAEDRRVCRTCGAEKPLDQFSKGAKGKRTSLCKRCDAARNQAWRERDDNGEKRNARLRAQREADPESFRAQSRRSYWAHVDERRDAGRAYAQSERGRQINQAAVKRYQKRHPERHAARILVRNAVKAGTLKKPRTCQARGCYEVKIAAHHHDYSKPLDIVWLCGAHHEHCHHKGPVRLNRSAPTPFATAPNSADPMQTSAFRAPTMGAKQEALIAAAAA